MIKDFGNWKKQRMAKREKKGVAVIIKFDPVCLLRSGSSHVMNV
jgi:hypothetical protein